MKGFLFIYNGRPDPEKENSREAERTGSFEYTCFYAAHKLGFSLYKGINRINAEEIKSLDYDIKFYNQHIYRNIFAIKDNWIAYKNLCGFLSTHRDIDVIHCNTPIGGVLGRICGHKYGKIVIYTAHGFHFYKGAPLFNRTVLWGIEKFLARWTDAIITINQEDYDAANKFQLKNGGKVFYVPGVGVDIHAFDSIVVDVVKKKYSLNLPSDSKVGIVVGDLNVNKNVSSIIRAAAICKNKIHLLICGQGREENKLKKLAKSLQISDRIHFLGYRNDIKELYKISNLFLFASMREGLPRTILEAMCAGIPCIVSKIRGNIDLIDDNKGGLLISPTDHVGFANAIDLLIEDEKKRMSFIAYNKEKSKMYSIDRVNEIMVKIYSEVLSTLLQSDIQ